jgi:hypothetical protein
MLVVGHPLEDAFVDEVGEPLVEHVAGDAEAFLEVVEACHAQKASRMINRLHHSPMTSRLWPMEQFMSRKLDRCMNSV